VVIATQIFHNSQPSHGGNRSNFEVMTSSLPKGIIRSFNFTFLYSDDVLSLNNYVDCTYHIEPEIKDTTCKDRSASYLDLHLEIESG
jgi:hypothetical protein